MNYIVIGTDHRMQHDEVELGTIIRAWLDRPRRINQITAIAEEYHRNLGETIAQRLASERKLEWYNVDMTTEEKHEAGILEEQRNRPIFQGAISCRLPSDDIREDAWIRKLVESASGATLVICGYLHFEPLVQKLRAQGHAVDQRVYLEVVPEIKLP